MSPARIFATLCAAGAMCTLAEPLRADRTAHIYEKPVTTNRDANMNRQAGFGGGGGNGGGGGTAIGNSSVVSVSGRGNTLILNINQNNSGNIIAGTSLNGSLTLD